MAVVLTPSHNDWLAIAVTVGVGSTLMVKLCVVPVHAPKTGVTTIVAVTAVPPLFTAVKAAMLPEPLAGRPIDGVSLVQVKLLAVPANVTAVVALPLQSSWLLIAATVAEGCTVIVNTFGAPGQLTAPNV